MLSTKTTPTVFSPALQGLHCRTFTWLFSSSAAAAPGTCSAPAASQGSSACITYPWTCFHQREERRFPVTHSWQQGPQAPRSWHYPHYLRFSSALKYWKCWSNAHQRPSQAFCRCLWAHWGTSWPSPPAGTSLPGRPFAFWWHWHFLFHGTPPVKRSQSIISAQGVTAEPWLGDWLITQEYKGNMVTRKPEVLFDETNTTAFPLFKLSFTSYSTAPKFLLQRTSRVHTAQAQIPEKPALS